MITVLVTHELKELLSDEISLLLHKENEFRFIECNGSYGQIVDVLSGEKVDLIMSAVTGIGSLQRLRKAIGSYQERKVLLTGVVESELLFESIRLGVKGHLSCDISLELLKRALKVVYNGEVWFDREVSSKVLQQFSMGNDVIKKHGKLALLSTRESEILECLCQGMKNRVIAQSLHITENTVKTHLQKIYEKLGVNNRMEAILRVKNSKDHPKVVL